MNVLVVATKLAAVIRKYGAPVYPGICELLVADDPDASAHLAPSADGVLAVAGRHPSPDLRMTAPSAVYDAIASNSFAFRDPSRMRDVVLSGDLRRAGALLGRYVNFLDEERRLHVIHALRATATRRIEREAAWTGEVRVAPRALQDDLVSARRGDVPVVFPGFARAWALGRWGFDTLLREHGDLLVSASPSRIPPDIFLRDYIDFALGDPREPMPRDTSSRGLGRRDDAEVLGTGGMRLPAALVEEEDAARLAELASNVEGQRLLWMGPAGSTTPLHRDLAAVTNVQVLGSKEWTIFPPEQASCLYVSEDDTNITGIGYQPCAADAYGRNVHDFPFFAKAMPAIVVVRPGDALFVPSGWFHAVRALEPALSISL